MRVELVRAWPHRCEQVFVEVPAFATVDAAMQAAGWALDAEFVALSVYSISATPQTVLHEGDRIELLRPLRLDPKQARRKRAEGFRRG
ncbi:MAG: RnfH family protein [Thermomonas sp.]|uniref:RnfH family protein n=1 Tax=Thermomonas sp. TaxID=1971895 RepID=UPI001EB0CABF|nr:RnfH family protein [Thermomonas sp.]MBV2209511.1 RnfH family protein [Thermomonas sp.]